MSHQIITPAEPLSAADDFTAESTFTSVSFIVASQMFQSFEAFLTDLAEVRFIKGGNDEGEDGWWHSR
jgi:hypothetical protein